MPKSETDVLSEVGDAPAAQTGAKGAFYSSSKSTQTSGDPSFDDFLGAIEFETSGLRKQRRVDLMTGRPEARLQYRNQRQGVCRKPYVWRASSHSLAKASL